jgi:hypothetical protein
MRKKGLQKSNRFNLEVQNKFELQANKMGKEFAFFVDLSAH